MFPEVIGWCILLLRVQQGEQSVQYTEKPCILMPSVLLLIFQLELVLAEDVVVITHGGAKPRVSTGPEPWSTVLEKIGIAQNSIVFRDMYLQRQVYQCAALFLRSSYAAFNFTQLNPDGKIISEVLHGVTQSKGFKKRCLNGENDARVNFSYHTFATLLSLYCNSS